VNEELEPSASRCPLCGLENQCGAVAGKSECWCYTVSIPTDLLDRIPEDAQGKACICRTCVEAWPSSKGSK
jgi:hypothetical protein